jgi:tRNA threonylcarbamoyl adenosine modification protein YjeE
MAPNPFSKIISLPNPEATAALARKLAPLLAPGDTLLLEGPIGAGKSHFARALILARLAMAGLIEDVPSPTFTLVQTYEDQTCEIWHADLYRLTSPHEVDELGLTDAFDTAICLVEWPDRLGSLAPTNALHLSLNPTGDETRTLTITAPNSTPSLPRHLEGAFADV